MFSKKLMAVAVAMMSMLPAMAQESESSCAVEAEIGTDLVSSYIWRGQKAGSVSLQPTASLGWKGLSLGAWGSFAVSPEKNGTDEEIDITLGYEIGGFHAGITDYYFFNCGHPYFKHGGIGETAHTFEANLGYDFGFMSVDWFTNFAGNDGVNGSGDRAYSSYVQLAAPFKISILDFTATVGIVPFRTDFYAADDSDGFHVNNIALQAGYTFELKNKPLSIPVFASVIANPSSRDMYFLVGAGVRIGK